MPSWLSVSLPPTDDFPPGPARRLLRLPRRVSGWAWGILGASLMLTALATVFAIRLSEATREAAVETAIGEDMGRLEMRVNASLAMLRATRSFLLATGQAPQPSHFAAFVAGLRIPSDYPGIQGIGWSPKVDSVGRAFRILYLEPQDERNRAALGYDMHSEPVRAAAMDRARDQGSYAMTGAVILKQEILRDKSPGFLIYTPVFEGGSVPHPAERPAQLRGFVYAPFRAVDFFAGLFHPGLVRLHSIRASTGDDGGFLYGERGAATGPVERRSTNFGGQAWTLTFELDPSPAGTERLTPPLVLATGVLLSLALFRFALSQSRARHRAEERSHSMRQQLQFAEMLVGIVSHDLRNPLNVIRLNAELLQRAKLQDEFARCVQRIHTSGDQSLRMIRDLLDFTQARLGGGIRVVRTPGDLAEIVQQAVDALQLGHVGRSVRMQASGDGAGTWDADRLTQVVNNLVGNALVYGAPGTPVSVRLDAGGAWVRLDVHNEGEPIPAAVQATLFEPLRQGESNAGASGRNIGLGLYIVRQIVRAHEGRVRCRSVAGEGTTFTIELPRASHHDLSGE